MFTPAQQPKCVVTSETRFGAVQSVANYWLDGCAGSSTALLQRYLGLVLFTFSSSAILSKLPSQQSMCAIASLIMFCWATSSSNSRLGHMCGPYDGLVDPDFDLMAKKFWYKHFIELHYIQGCIHLLARSWCLS